MAVAIVGNVNYFRGIRDRVLRSRPLQRQIEAAIQVDGLHPQPTVSGSVWGVCIVKNEADIIAHTIEHFLRQGLDGLIVVDNGSTDETLKILLDLAQGDDRIFVGRDREPAFYQGRKTSYLSHLAWSAGADWIVPFDADEQWFAVGKTVPEFLRATRATVVECAMYDVCAAPSENILDLATARTLYIDTMPTGWSKVAFRAQPWVWVEMGNHGVRMRGRRVSGLRLRHFPYRSLEQASRKVVEGRGAIEQAFGATSGFGGHWKEISRLSNEDFRSRWAALLHGEKFIEGSPVVPRVMISATEPWSTWDPAGELTPHGTQN